MANDIWLPLPKTQKLIISQIKGAVCCTVSDDGDILVLVNHHDKFEWMDITECLPLDSEREYPIELAEVINIK